MKIRMIGPLPPPYGGATVYFQMLQEEIGKASGVELEVIDTTTVSSARGAKKLLALLAVLRAAWSGTHRPDIISVHMSIGALSLFAPYFGIVGKLTSTPVIIHRFGGNLIHQQRFPRALALKIAYRVCGAALIETKAQLAEVKALKTPTIWFPNIRKTPDSAPPCKTQCRKFLYLSQVFPEKGIPELLDAFSSLNKKHPDTRLDIYGQILRNSYQVADFNHPGVAYQGVVKPDNVYATIARYDALVLPTYYKGEGYPGIIIEAFHLGLPVITTRWQSVPDIVNDNCGILIPPKDSTALENAMETLYADDTGYQHLAAGALAQAKDFSADQAVAKYLELCRSLT